MGQPWLQLTPGCTCAGGTTQAEPTERAATTGRVTQRCGSASGLAERLHGPAVPSASAKKWPEMLPARGLDSASSGPDSIILLESFPPSSCQEGQWSANWTVIVTFACECSISCSGFFSTFWQFLPHPAHVPVLLHPIQPRRDNWETQPHETPDKAEPRVASQQALWSSEVSTTPGLPSSEGLLVLSAWPTSGILTIA